MKKPVADMTNEELLEEHAGSSYESIEYDSTLPAVAFDTRYSEVEAEILRRMKKPVDNQSH